MTAQVVNMMGNTRNPLNFYYLEKYSTKADYLEKDSTNATIVYKQLVLFSHITSKHNNSINNWSVLFFHYPYQFYMYFDTSQIKSNNKILKADHAY